MAGLDRIRKVEAIIISHAEYGEADRLLSLFTREMGKVKAIAKGVRKEHSRKAGHLEPFNCSTLMLAKGGTFWIISQAETVNDFQAIKSDLNRTVLAAYCLELTERFMTEDEVHPELYRLLKETLGRLSRQDTPFNVIRYFEMRFLELVGFRPELSNCVQCRKEIRAEDQFFSFLQGGVVCPKCESKVDSTQPIQMTTLKYLRHFQRSSYEQVRQVEVPPAVQKNIEGLMQSYITFLAERRLNTPRFYRAIHKSMADKLDGPISDDKIDREHL